MRLVRVIAVLATLGCLGASVGVAQSVEPAGDLLVAPAEGNLDSALSLATVGLCERGTTYMVTVAGKGVRTDEGQDIIVGAADLRYLEPTGFPSHEVFTSETLGQFFQRAGVAKPRGEYVLSMICRNRLDVEALQVFSATIDIDAQGRYSALGSAALDLPTAIDEAEIDFEVIPGTEEAEITEENASAVSEAGEAQGTGTIDASSGGIPGGSGCRGPRDGRGNRCTECWGRVCRAIGGLPAGDAPHRRRNPPGRRDVGLVLYEPQGEAFERFRATRR